MIAKLQLGHGQFRHVCYKSCEIWRRSSLFLWRSNRLSSQFTFAYNCRVIARCLITVSDGFGAWSSNGCRTDGYENSVQKCRCSHLTNFAILLDVTGEGTPKEAALALSIVTYIGCAISLICLLITLITFGVFRLVCSVCYIMWYSVMEICYEMVALSPLIWYQTAFVLAVFADMMCFMIFQ